MMGVSIATVVNWEKGKAKPTPALFRSVHDFLGCDPAPVGKTLSERVTVKQRQLGVTLAQMAQYLGWDPGSFRRYLNGMWRLSSSRHAILEALPCRRHCNFGSDPSNAAATVAGGPYRGSSARRTRAASRRGGRPVGRKLSSPTTDAPGRSNEPKCWAS